jgi:cytoskeletal protein RodZ
MRKLILIAVMSLLATQAYAGGPRSLSLAATNASQQATEQPAPSAAVAPDATQATATTPAANVQTATTTPTSTQPAGATVATAPAVAAPAHSTAAPVAGASETAKPRHRQPSTEARVIRELHRHGIYW